MDLKPSKYLILEALFEKFNIDFHINIDRRPNLKRDTELKNF